MLYVDEVGNIITLTKLCDVIKIAIGWLIKLSSVSFLLLLTDKTELKAFYLFFELDRTMILKYII